jgi:hypothetical protein
MARSHAPPITDAPRWARYPSALSASYAAYIAGLRLTLKKGEQPIELRVVHLDLYFFHDLDLVQLNVEVRGHDLPLASVRQILFRFGRGCNSGFVHAWRKVVALDEDAVKRPPGQVLADGWQVASQGGDALIRLRAEHGNGFDPTGLDVLGGSAQPHQRSNALRQPKHGSSA